MILTVQHVTTYAYAQPMRQLVQSLRLFPVSTEAQTVLEWDVLVEASAEADSSQSIGADLASRSMAQQSDAKPANGAAWTGEQGAGGAANGQPAGGQASAGPNSGAETQGGSAGAQIIGFQPMGGQGASQSQSPSGMTQSMGGMRQSFGDPRATAQKPLTRGHGAGVGACFRDGSGDRVETISIRGPVSRVTITVQGRVETRDTAGILKGHRETSVPGLYLRPTRSTDPDAGLTELARKVMAATEGQSPLTLAHALSHEISERIAYEPGETSASTTAAEALARGKGVCQDHAHALIAAAHVAGLPARYVVGYLATEGAIGEASHAWAELFLDGFGWIGFDPANRCCPDERYIRLCSGYDAQDAAPIRGVASGAEAEDLAVDVAVRQQQA